MYKPHYKSSITKHLSCTNMHEGTATLITFSPATHVTGHQTNDDLLHLDHLMRDTSTDTEPETQTDTQPGPSVISETQNQN